MTGFIVRRLLVLGMLTWGTVALAAPKAELRAQVSDDLHQVHVQLSAECPAADGYVQVVLPAQRYTQIPEPLSAQAEREFYVHGLALGGFSNISVSVDGQPCLGPGTRLKDGTEVWRCKARGALASVKAQADLQVPEQNGPFSVRGRQLTLGGGWFILPQTPGQGALTFDYQVQVQVPAGVAVVLGDRWMAANPESARRIVTWHGEARQVPLVVLPPWTGSRAVTGARLISPRLRGPVRGSAQVRFKETLRAVQEGFTFLKSLGLPVPSSAHPLLLVEAPLRHNLARVSDGVLLVSDRAFRQPPMERFWRFHRFALLRELYSTWFLRGRTGPDAVFDADAAGAYFRDEYTRTQAGGAEDAFDVLSLWAFIPAVDSLLYAPQLPFLGTYFRLIQEADPLRANLTDPPSQWARGKLGYEKLLDRYGAQAVHPVLLDVARGDRLITAAQRHLPSTAAAVLKTWTGQYPKVQYRLQNWTDQVVAGPVCAPAQRCYAAQVQVQRLGEVVAEPVTVLLTDEDGRAKRFYVQSSTAAVRVLTATLSAGLAEVVIDPDGRLAETPTLEIPSPKLDNRSHPRWRVLLNSFNVQPTPSANNVAVVLDLGFSQVQDVHWRFATRASYGPSAISVSARSTYKFGRAVTPASLVQWVGAVAAGEYLRPDFAGATRSAFAASGAVYYGYDDRQSIWAPEPGLAFRASLGFSQTFAAPEPDSGLTRGALRLSLRGLRSWRLGGQHQLSVRAKAGGFLTGTPNPQLQYALGGRNNFRGYVVDTAVGRWRAILSGEWVHPLAPDVDINAGWLVWWSGLDGALFADIGGIGDVFGHDRAPTEALIPPARTQFRADVGYGLRFYIDYFGMQPAVMAVDVALPLLEDRGAWAVGRPAIYIDFAQSFLAF